VPHLQIGSHAAWYDEHGEGLPLLLIPGLGASRWSWWKQIDPLSRQYRVVSLDNRDAGDSAQATDPYSIGDLADDAAQVIRALRLGPAFVVGWSMGTFISQELTVRRPDLVSKLILVAGSAGGPTQTRATPEIGALLQRTEGESVEARVRRTYPLLAAPDDMRQHPEDLDRIVWSQSLRPMSLACYQRQLGAIMMWPGVGPKLRDMKTPTLVIHGDLDPLVPYPNGQYIASQIPGATLSTYAGVGHLPPIEASERFNRDVDDFLHASA
jgi:pimeloyl-ACP methyl ester carboxylesterase